jgi:LysM repeat protein
MDDTRSRRPGRLLAPIAIVVFAIALLVVVTSAGGGNHSKSPSAATRQEQRDLELKKSRAKKASSKRAGKLPQNVYVVKTGDTLGSIAQKTGIPVERLQGLNPNLDPQALVSGQRLKLR